MKLLSVISSDKDITFSNVVDTDGAVKLNCWGESYDSEGILKDKMNFLVNEGICKGTYFMEAGTNCRELLLMHKRRHDLSDASLHASAVIKRKILQKIVYSEVMLPADFGVYSSIGEEKNAEKYLMGLSKGLNILFSSGGIKVDTVRVGLNSRASDERYGNISVYFSPKFSTVLMSSVLKILRDKSPRERKIVRYFAEHLQDNFSFHQIDENHWLIAAGYKIWFAKKTMGFSINLREVLFSLSVAIGESFQSSKANGPVNAVLALRVRYIYPVILLLMDEIPENIFPVDVGIYPTNVALCYELAKSSLKFGRRIPTVSYYIPVWKGKGAKE